MTRKEIAIERAEHLAKLDDAKKKLATWLPQPPTH